MPIIDGAESFYFKGTNEKAVLLLHGYTGCCSEMRPLGEYLHKQGYTVLCPLLPGHGTTVDDLEKTEAWQWLQAAHEACHELLNSYDTVYVVGLSMGGQLAIDVMAKEPVAKGVFISTPIFVKDKRVTFIPILKHFIRYLPKHKKDYGEMSRYCISYEKMPTRPLQSLFAMVKAGKKLLPAIKRPVLVLQSKTEHTVMPESAQYIFDHVGTQQDKKKLKWFYRSGHILTLDAEHDIVFEEIAKFFAK